MAAGKFISYHRVSTEKQGRSGLGLEAQKQAVADYLNGGSWQLLSEFVEIESGKRDDNRPQLAAALAACRATGATLVVARLDRLARNAHFLLGLQNAGVRFVAVDMPDANEMTVGIMAVIAQGEAKAISARTKSALAAAKVRGIALGGLRRDAKEVVINLTTDAIIKGVKEASKARSAKASTFAANCAPLVLQLQKQGLTLRGIAAELNAKGYQTPRGKGQWQAQTVKNLLARLEE
jgi:DNA invertase Pin-like site-specific DNA recombinase